MNLPGFLRENKHLFLTSLFTFLLIYTSTFVKGYGYFIDEFYYIACADNPAAGYVDHPPLAPLLLTMFQFIFGNSIYAIRILPALAQSMAVFFTGLIAAEIGGRKFSQFLASCAAAASATIIAFGGFYSMNAFEPLIAVILLLFIIRMTKEKNLKRWIPIGIVIGTGMMNKHTFGLFIIGLIFSLLIVGKWKLIFNRWFIYGGLIASIIFLPNIIWQIVNDYPSVEFYRNISTDKNVYTPPAAFIMGQVMGMSPTTVFIWLPGFIFLMFSGRTKEFRFLAVLFLSLFLFMMFSGTSRSDRLAFAYPPVFAGGALCYEFFFGKYNLKWMKGILVVFLFTGLALALPLILPFFSYETVQSYVKYLGFNTELEKGKKPPLPQLLSDRIGWEEKFKMVLSAYESLPDNLKKQTMISGSNYGQAGAFELFGKDHDFPPVVCDHNNYYLWSTERLKGDVLLAVEQETSYNGLKEIFGSVEMFPGKFVNKYVSDHENNLRVFICREPKITFAELLERSKNYH